MRRRPLLQATVALAAVGLAGCIGGGPDDGGGDNEGPDGTPDGGGGGEGPTDSPPPDGGDGSPEGPATSFEVTGSRCGNQANEAEVTFDDGQVSIEGTTWGNDACYTARLESATLDDGTLTVAVVTVNEAEEDESCAQCITEIEYRSFVETPTTPAEVIVTHDDETVTTAHP